MISTAAIIISLLQSPTFVLPKHPPQQETLAPFPIYATPLGETYEEIFSIGRKKYSLKWDSTSYSLKIHEIKSDKERPEPLIIKISKYKYLIYAQGKIRIKEVKPGTEDLWDWLYGIDKPPPPPPGGDNSPWKPDEPDRWKWKP